ncbi:MAG: HIT domain-containing protein [Acidimicrobiales bacterium]
MEEPPFDRLYSGWRLTQTSGLGGDGLPHADLPPEPGRSLFETLEQSGLPDEETYILVRRDHTFAILNVFPYTSGHLMALPKRAVPTLAELEADVFHELWSLVREAITAVNVAFRPQGLNVGLNEGTAGGGSIPEHLHVHVVPRWDADTNFMTSIANTRILPVTLIDTWHHLRNHWPR